MEGNKGSEYMLRNSQTNYGILCTLILACFLVPNDTFVGVEALVSSNDIIRVYDNVLPEKSCQVLHEAASKSGLGHKVFQRPLSSKQQNNIPIIERAIDSILTEMGDTVDSDDGNQYVEYWTRQEWRHIEAHADVDEHLAKEQDALGNTDNAFRYPRNGHVLYLKIGSEVQGPTCVFPNLKSGGELVGKRQGQDSFDRQKGIELVTVPAVEGRLLRFEGSSLHAVPRPADLWFLSFVKGAPNYTPEDEWGRSVILFNTWTEKPPKDVPSFDITKEVDVDTKSTKDFVNGKDVWEEVFYLGGSSREEGGRVCDTAMNDNEVDEPMSKVKIWLLGNERRRNHVMRTIKMKAKSSIKDVFLEPSLVSLVHLEH